MGEISAYSPNGSHAPVDRVGAGSAGLDVSEGAWGGDIVAFNDLRAQLSPGGGPVVTSAVDSDRKVRRNKASGRYFMRRTGWQAQLQRITVVTSERDVRPLPNGKFTTCGDWTIARVDEYPAAERVKERVGDVPDDSKNPALKASASGPTDASSSTPSEAEAPFGGAFRQLQYLPSAVREGVVRLIPEPDFFQCEAIRYTQDGEISHHTVSALRMSGRKALVV